MFVSRNKVSFLSMEVKPVVFLCQARIEMPYFEKMVLLGNMGKVGIDTLKQEKFSHYKASFLLCEKFSHKPNAAEIIVES